MVTFQSGGRSFDPKKFAKDLERVALDVAIRELEKRAQGAAASIVDPETGKHALVFVRQRDKTNLVVCTHGSPAFARELERRLGMAFGLIESRNPNPSPEVPRLYLAHASEDHEGMARPLAERMMAEGIEVWFDEWEIKTGDSLRRKMEQGLEECTHFLVLLTPHSLGKPWVESEIDVGFVRSIGGKSRFLGIRVGTDVSQLSAFLQTLRCPQYDLDDEGQVAALIADIHGVSRKPPLGPAPRYVKTVSQELAGAWSKSALAVAEHLVRASKLGRKFDPQITVPELAKTLDLPEEDVRLGLLDLADLGLVERSGEVGSQRYWPNVGLFVEFDRHFLDFDNRQDGIKIVNWLISQDINLIKIEELAPRFADWTERRLNSALNYLDEAKIVESSKAMNSGPWPMFRIRITDRTRRFVRDNG